jgi:hypothetical protein
MKSDNSKKTGKRTTRIAKTTPARSAPKMPSILLEGDVPAAAVPSGPGQRYALGPTPPLEPAAFEEAGELPEAYGTQRLLLTARDPHWLYAHWDFTREQLKRLNGLSADGHLVLRIHKEQVSDTPIAEVHVHPESRNWFVHVDPAGTRFVAELGYYQRRGNWNTVATSAVALTPPDTMSEDFSLWFETLPADLQLDYLVRLVRKAVSENVPLMEAIQQLRASGFKGLPNPQAISSGRWTAEQERALAELVRMDGVRRIWMGSLEITELIRQQLQAELFSAAAAQFSIPGSWSAAVSSFSSPYGGMERKGFWFNVNAELIIYGATEPDAHVSIGGRTIKLRSDGTFSYRFALPDGRFPLPAVATSADGTDSRSADLKFSRSTEYRGDVGKHPQDPKLKAPLVENVA